MFFTSVYHSLSTIKSILKAIDMEPKEIQKFKEVQQRAKQHLTTLESKSNTPGDYFVPLPVEGYQDLQNKLYSLIKVSLLALEADDKERAEILEDPINSVCAVLEMALHLIPYEEAEFLDDMRSVV